MSIDAIYDAMERSTVDGKTLNDIVGGGRALQVGRELFDFLLTTGPISRDHHVFEIGCGCGRAAVMIADHLHASGAGRGRYVGVDIIPSLVDFCIRDIESVYPNARFYLSSDRNPQYDGLILSDRRQLEHLAARGRLTDEQLTSIPRTRPFDLALAFSVFTHLGADQTRQMLELIASLMAEDGRAVLSFFVLDTFSAHSVRNGTAAYFDGLPPERLGGDVLIDDRNGPNGAVAYALPFLSRVLLESGLVMTSIECGRWRTGRGRVFQDMVTVTKKACLPADFDAARYFELHDDVKRSGIAAAYHYIAYGRAEGRRY
jgi:SAM-dependent methyltransferase